MLMDRSGILPRKTPNVTRMLFAKKLLGVYLKIWQIIQFLPRVEANH